MVLINTIVPSTNDWRLVMSMMGGDYGPDALPGIIGFAVIGLGGILVLNACAGPSPRESVEAQITTTAVMREQNCDEGKACADALIPLGRAEPGETYDGVLTIDSESDHDLVADVTMRPQLVRLEDGTPYVVREELIRVQAGFIEADGDPIEIPYSITIPDVPEGMTTDDPLAGSLVISVRQGAMAA